MFLQRSHPLVEQRRIYLGGENLNNNFMQSFIIVEDIYSHKSLKDSQIVLSASKRVDDSLPQKRVDYS